MNSSALFNKPLQPPPPVVLPNHFNPQTRGRDLTTICSIFLAFMIISVAIRAYTKLWIMRKLAWDDRKSPRPRDRMQDRLTITVACFIGFVCLTLRVLSLLSLTESPMIASYADLLCLMCEEYVPMRFSSIGVYI